MKDGINVLSLFDGMSCGQIALERAGIKVKNYYASEIDKNAIIIAKKNYPNTIHIGDVREVTGADLPRIDLVIGGSPCQGFSVLGKRLNFSDPRSVLFFEFVRLVKECKPRLFLLENVKMKKEYQDIISKYLDVEPMDINSNLVSAQNRRRFYWTNSKGVSMPKMVKDIRLIDILESLPGHNGVVNGERLPTRFVKETKRAAGISENERGYRPHQKNRSGIGELGRIMKVNGKTNTLVTAHAPKLAVNSDIDNLEYRKLTPIECERLQTVPDNYTEGVSNSQRYKMLGNGWTVDVIAHIFKEMKNYILDESTGAIK